MTLSEDGAFLHVRVLDSGNKARICVRVCKTADRQNGRIPASACVCVCVCVCVQERYDPLSDSPPPQATQLPTLPSQQKTNKRGRGRGKKTVDEQLAVEEGQQGLEQLPDKVG